MTTLENTLQQMAERGLRCTAFFYNTGIKEWQFSMRDANGSYSYGYGATASEAAAYAVANYGTKKEIRVIKLLPDNKIPADIGSFL